MSKVLLCSIVLWALLTTVGYTEVVESVRVPQQSTMVLYFPSFGMGKSTSPLPWHDNLSVSAHLLNLTPVGPNFNLKGAFTHATRTAPVSPSTGEISGQVLGLNLDDTSLVATSVFAHFYQVKAGVFYRQSRVVEKAAAVSAFDYDLVTGELSLATDQRFSGLQPWSNGVTPLFPDNGFYGSLGGRAHRAWNVYDRTVARFTTIRADAQQLLPLSEIVVLSLAGWGESAVTGPLDRPYKLASTVLGAYQWAGDYAGTGSVELRVLWPQGVFWDTPEFLYLNSMLLKCSPGLAASWNVAAVGDFGGLPSVIHSAAISPLVAIRINGTLSAVLRLDFSVSSSPSSPLVLGLSFGNLNETPSPVYRGRF